MKSGDLVFADADEIFNGSKIVSKALFWREEDELSYSKWLVIVWP